MKKIVPYPDRIRRVSKSFGWGDHKLLREGWLTEMSMPEIVLYFFLILAADREGVSYYRKEKIADATGLDFIEIGQAAEDLQRRSLIAFRPFREHNPNGFYQVLDVPPRTMAVEIDRKAPDAYSIGEILRQMVGGQHGNKSMGRNSQT